MKNRFKAILVALALTVGGLVGTFAVPTTASAWESGCYAKATSSREAIAVCSAGTVTYQVRATCLGWSTYTVGGPWRNAPYASYIICKPGYSVINVWMQRV